MESADGQRQGGSVDTGEDGDIMQKGLRSLQDQNNKNSTKFRSQSASLPSKGNSCPPTSQTVGNSSETPLCD